MHLASSCYPFKELVTNHAHSSFAAFMSSYFLANSAGPMFEAAEAHFVQQRPSKDCSNSGQPKGGHITPRHNTGSALLFGPTPPESPFAHDLSSGTSMFSAQQSGQQVPASLALMNLKGFWHWTATHWTPVHVSIAEVASAAPEHRSTMLLAVRNATFEKCCIARGLVGYCVAALICNCGRDFSGLS
eukprot:CAMPEP_0172712704 /NCGR_PEP_ID=MMETSP1074-20121228/61257_1 /TAXON_ID=2916 /ORGANISM="Ceratium fusus, Strain PA161109" /LENGTH=186 /DNA_ID=CAMNT_0013536675 /DNA_START=126 /DNA_END=683 /DNA_ORIENTATION=+